jgi:hypothetical protein
LSYIDNIAAEVRANVAPEFLPDGDTTALFRLYAVLLLAKGTDVTAEDVHNAWAAWMDANDPEHPSVRPYHELDAETRAGDQPYVDAIRAASRALGNRRSEPQ